MRTLIALLALTSASSAETASDWRAVEPQNLLLIDTKYGQVAVELAPEFAPNHAARLRALIRAHFYDGLSFYRVIDGFVAQGGIGEGTASTRDHPVMAKGLDKWPPPHSTAATTVTTDRSFMFSSPGFAAIG